MAGEDKGEEIELEENKPEENQAEEDKAEENKLEENKAKGEGDMAEEIKKGDARK